MRSARALIRTRYGSPDVIETRTIDLPVPKADEVLVRVHAASVNRGDLLALRGWPYLARLSYGPIRPRQQVLGTDVAGQVEAVGPRVRQFQVGDPVFGWADGAFAEFVTASERELTVRPDNITAQQAAAVPTTATTALQALRDQAHVEASDHVLIVGASGGVGTSAVQIAKALGAEVTGVCSTRNVDIVRSAGADHIIDYTKEDFTHVETKFDVIIDLVGNRPLRECRRALTPNGRFVVVGGQNPRSPTGMKRFLRAALLSPVVKQRLRPLFAKRSEKDLVLVRELIQTGKVFPVIDRSFGLPDGRAAFQHLEAGHARGKTVLVVHGSASPRPLESQAGVRT